MWKEDSLSCPHFLHIALSESPITRRWRLSVQGPVCTVSCSEASQSLNSFSAEGPSMKSIWLSHTQYWECFMRHSWWFGTMEWVSQSLPSQGISIFIALNPTVARDSEKCHIVLAGQGTFCLSTFPDQVWHYLWCLKGLQSCLAIWVNINSHSGIECSFP
jgi:hypothetical protein